MIARRLMPDGVPRLPFALTAVLLLWMPYTFFVGSFMEQSFLSQAVSELFAVAMWWTIVVVERRPSLESVALFALFGAAAFLTWPIWSVRSGSRSSAAFGAAADWRMRARHLALALIPIAILAAIYATTRSVRVRHDSRGGLRRLTVAAHIDLAVHRPHGWRLIAATDQRARAAVLLAAILLQAAALVVPACAAQTCRICR